MFVLYLIKTVTLCDCFDKYKVYATAMAPLELVLVKYMDYHVLIESIGGQSLV